MGCKGWCGFCGLGVISLSDCLCLSLNRNDNIDLIDTSSVFINYPISHPPSNRLNVEQNYIHHENIASNETQSWLVTPLLTPANAVMLRGIAGDGHRRLA